MVMGGGMMLRNVAKLASLGAGARGAAPVCSTCRAAPNAALRASSSNCVCDTAHGPSQSLQSAPQRWTYDQDWVVTEEHEDPPEYSIRDHLVFGKPPTHVEVEEATSELQNALTLGLAAPEGANSGFLPPFSTIETDPSLSGHENTKTDASDACSEQTIDWIEPQLVHSFQRNNQVGYVAEAFHLLQSTPKVQEVVMSLAQDKAVWDAILNNDKVKEFRQQLQESDGHLNDDDKTHHCDDSKLHEQAGFTFGGLNFVSRVLEDAKSMFFHVKEMLVELIKNMFSADKNGDTEERDTVDWAVKSCFMLAMVVTFIVLLKRAAVV